MKNTEINTPKTETATFAAGCFWGVEETFRTIPGVIKTRVGYTGGTTKHPTYEDVCSDTTGHAESIEITYDPQKISYEKLLDIFWKNHNPTEINQQGPDIGSQYRSAIFYHTEKQKEIAETSKQNLEDTKKYSKPIATQILEAQEFYPAEEYHQKYLMKRGKNIC